MSASLDVHALIPHRAPFLLIDRVVERPSAGVVVTEKRVSANDAAFFDGAFPDMLLLDAMAQTAACARGEHGHRGMLVQVSDATFSARAHVGDTVRFVATQIATMGTLVRFAIEAHIESSLIAKAELTFAIESAA